MVRTWRPSALCDRCPAGERRDVTSAMHAIMHTTHLTMAAHSNDHLVARQAMSDGGLVLDMRASAASRCQQMKLVSSCVGAASAGVPGSALWEEVRH
ncbi:hypothetical protein ZWY2020_014000 [Hordeum vulgare]|nr:hypothetical protein ZWY2020_014000 [Hordeum vulgare]